MSDVFISYSQPDAACARDLVERLEGQGMSCWIAPRDIAPSADWAAEIIDAISAARIMVLVFSGASNHSPQVRREVERAVHKQVSILPFRIEDVLPSKSLEFFLSTQHWMDAFTPPRETHYQRLCSYLKSQLALLPAPAGAVHAAVAAAAPDERRQSFAAAQLRHIEGELAPYVGPIAAVLVRRAAAQAGGLQELIERLAGELDSEAERSAFAQRCRLPSAG
jgi:hypothetical protein